MATTHSQLQASSMEFKSGISSIMNFCNLVDSLHAVLLQIVLFLCLQTLNSVLQLQQFQASQYVIRLCKVSEMSLFRYV